MTKKVKEITSYLRNAIAAHTNQRINFKNKNHYYFQFEQLKEGQIDKIIFDKLITEENHSAINVILVPKVVKTMFESQKIAIQKN